SPHPLARPHHRKAPATRIGSATAQPTAGPRRAYKSTHWKQTQLVTPCYSWRPRLAAHRRRLPVEVTASRISLLLRPPNIHSSAPSLVAPPRRGFFSRGFGLGAGSRLRLRPNKATSSSASASSSSRVSP